MPKGYPGSKSCPRCGDPLWMEEASYCAICGEPLFKTRKRLKENESILEHRHFRIHLSKYSALLVQLSVHTPDDDMIAIVLPYKKLRSFINSFEEWHTGGVTGCQPK